MSYSELISKLKDSPHSRIPVWAKNPENIVGVLHVRKLIGENNIDQKKFNILKLLSKTMVYSRINKIRQSINGI